MGQSEVARLKQQVAAEYMAAKWGLTGLRYGTSQHRFITTSMERIEACHKLMWEVKPCR